jgi:hypothetical protein
VLAVVAGLAAASCALLLSNGFKVYSLVDPASSVGTYGYQADTVCFSSGKKAKKKKTTQEEKKDAYYESIPFLAYPK